MQISRAACGISDPPGLPQEASRQGALRGAGWLPVPATRRRLDLSFPRGFLWQPRQGGPILADCGVTRQSRCFGIAYSSRLALGQIGSVMVSQICRKPL